ncbi:AraC family transcriptional regulator [Pseudomonas chlororaphis]|uniref:AraC family transcriptional regulator n=1 Tax=Pseudomonas chlororaphis TaxID=587753 RepID=UPI00164B1365|nr:AraC family transcriptional regulator [Pseudomonas chlororaphis]
MAAIVATLAEDGIAPAAVLANSGLEEAEMRDPATRVSFRQVTAVFRNAARLATDPASALRAGARMGLTAYGMYGYGLLSSPTSSAQIEFAIKYNRVLGTPAGPVAYVREANMGIYTYDVLIASDPTSDLYRFALEFAYSAKLTLGRDLCGSEFLFDGLRAACPEPAHASLYREWFRCPVEFDCPSNEVLVDRRWSEFTARMPDPFTHESVRSLCHQLLVDLDHSGGMASLVRRTLVERMPWRFPTVDTMANELSVHPRALRRLLEHEGTTYKDLLADVRCRLAIEYLRNTRITTEEIASRLGYSDAANFRRAFSQWTGKTPSEYRGM